MFYYFKYTVALKNLHAFNKYFKKQLFANVQIF